MSALDADEERLITIVGIEPNLEVPVSYLPEGSLWAAAVEQDESATELDFPKTFQGPDGSVQVEPWMGKVVADFLEVMEGTTPTLYGTPLPDDPTKWHRTGVREIDLVTQKPVLREVIGLNPELYVTKEQHDLVRDLNLEQLLKLTLLTYYLGFRDLDDIIAVKVWTMINASTYEEAQAILKRMDEVLPDSPGRRRA